MHDHVKEYYGRHLQRTADLRTTACFTPDTVPAHLRTLLADIHPEVSGRYYVLYEGIRGPAAGDPGDSQFGLGLARSRAGRIDGPWDKYPGNPILQDLPGNIGLGHADLLVVDGQTRLYTSLDGATRSRLVLRWK